jgi:4-diphosphocytidyl-2-C-methyl-D-erythritol kinase
MKSLQNVLAPAKLNLFLHITGRRTDGYHLLQSVFMLIDWYDTLHFEVRPNGQISREDLSVPLPADDLITRAARLLQQTSGTSMGAHIAIDKSIPAQAGMGGGSSDAASTLLALNRLWNLKLPLPQLEALGLQLGADVPFFLRGRNAWVEGVGEQITPIALPPARFCVIKPAKGVDTASIFRHPQLERATKAATIAVFAADPYGFGHNDLQPVAEMLCPEVAQAIELFEASGLQARMTGSGSAVFAHCAPGKAAIQAPNHWVVRECSNLEVHPLQGWAASDN